jgi:hypothetical protein
MVMIVMLMLMTYLWRPEAGSSSPVATVPFACWDGVNIARGTRSRTARLWHRRCRFQRQVRRGLSPLRRHKGKAGRASLLC